MKDFIEIYDNFIADEDCDKLIGEMEGIFEERKRIAVPDPNHYGRLQLNGLVRDDEQIYIPSQMNHIDQDIKMLLFKAFIDYSAKYPAVKNNADFISIGEFKAQKTHKGAAGFSTFHSEQGSGPSSGRFLVWMIYLNDVEDGGETEFIYQHKKIKPKKGSLVFFPASFTHTHRGNPPYSNDKYVLTGWFLFSSWPHEQYLWEHVQNEASMK